MKNFLTYSKFFGENGVTSTSANYLCNIAKEMTRTYDDINRLSFNDVEVVEMGTGKKYKVESGITEEQFSNIDNNLLNKAKLNALIAWFREAIKAREYQLDVIDRYDFDDWLKNEHNITDLNFGFDDIEIPDMSHITTEEYIINNFNVKDLNEYFYLQNICSVLGKFVHPGGTFDNAKANIEKNIDKVSIHDTQSTNLIYKTSSSIPMDNINAKFFELQDKHRDYQKRLNSILFTVENAVKNYNDEVDKKSANYTIEQRQILANRKAEEAKWRKKFNDWKVEERNKLRAQKIVIPNELKDTYELVNNYGKKSR